MAPIITEQKIKFYKSLIGIRNVAGQEQIVCLPDELRMRHVHVVGRPRMGTTTLLMHMIGNDIKNGHGVAIIDPRGDLVDRNRTEDNISKKTKG